MKTQKATPMDDARHLADQSVTRFNGVLGDAMERGVSIFGNSMRALQRESMRFLTRRMEDNARAAQEFGSCKSFPDLLVMQQRWLADMTRAYSEEWARYGDLMTEALHDTENAAEHEMPTPRRGEPH
jgi:phasin protein